MLKRVCGRALAGEEGLEAAGAREGRRRQEGRLTERAMGRRQIEHAYL
jgi:hypothetical protein